MKIEIDHINFQYNKASDFCLNLQDIHYEFAGTLGIFGLSGSGKSTLGKVLAQLIASNDIAVHYEPKNPFVLYSSQMAENIFLGTTLQRALDFISQNNTYVSNLETKCEKYINHFGENLVKLLPQQGNELSVGELRKFTLSLALSCEPDLLILDEPTTGLDLHSKVQFLKLMNAYTGKKIIISHDYEILTKLCDEFWIIHEGQLIFQGKRDAIEKDVRICNQTGLHHYFDRKEKRNKIYHRLMTS